LQDRGLHSFFDLALKITKAARAFVDEGQ